jgi:hypothetical protein
VQLGSEAHLQVAHPLGAVVHGQLVRRAREPLGVLQHLQRPREPLEIFVEVRVGVLVDQLVHPLLAEGGQRDAPLLRQLDQGGEAKGAVEVDVEVGLGDRADELVAVRGRHDD